MRSLSAPISAKESAKIFFLLKTLFVLMLCGELGLQLNQAVMRVNNGKMPVFENIPEVIIYAENDTHTMGDSNTRLAYFADWIHVGDFVSSPGDFLIDFSCLFLALFFLYLVLQTSLIAFSRPGAL